MGAETVAGICPNIHMPCKQCSKVPAYASHAYAQWAMGGAVRSSHLNLFLPAQRELIQSEGRIHCVPGEGTEKKMATPAPTGSKLKLDQGGMVGKEILLEDFK